MGIFGGFTFITIGLEPGIAVCIVASTVAPAVTVTKSGFPPGDVSWVAFSILDAAEQPASKVANRTTVIQ
jgi:hypothetical protein